MRTLLKWLPAIFIMSCSWYLSSQPSIAHMPRFPHADKVVHFICFGGLCFWITFALKKKNITAIALSSVYGIIDEIHQSFVPGRSSSVFDWMADSAGSAAGFLLFLLTIKILHKIKIRREETLPRSEAE